MSTVAAITESFPEARRQTYAFLESARETAHVYLMTDVDVTQLKRVRAQRGNAESFVSFVVKAAGEVLTGYPDARAVLSDGLYPRLTRLDEVHAKVLFDKTVAGQRCVVSGTVERVHERSLSEIQQVIDEHKRAEVDAHGPFKQVRMLQRLPLWLVRLVYRGVLRDPERRARLQGTFSVTSVGQESVRTILPLIGGTLGFGVGRIVDSAVVRAGRIEVAPMLTLSLAFDHRVLDGAMASELLARVKNRLENWELS
jgi:pyruvate/2-oxoglutarate dehydrogenase complex dihydrolipoamide acyltransferase (E2) component